MVKINSETLLSDYLLQGKLCSPIIYFFLFWQEVCGPQEGHCEKRCEIQGGGHPVTRKNFSQPFLGCHLGFHTMTFLGGAHIIYSWAVFGLDFTLYNCMLQSWHIAINGCCYLSLFLGRYLQCITYIHFY